MAPLSISVTGQSVIELDPERGVLHIAVKSDGPNQDTVSKEVTTTSNQLNEFFRNLSPKAETGTTAVDAPVTTFSSTHVRTWSRVPTDKDNKPLDRVYYASSSFAVTFRDFSKMSEVVGKLVAFPKVEIASIDWRLTAETTKALGSQSRKEAMHDAINKAKDFAEVIGREVVAAKVEDGGYSGTFGATRQPMGRALYHRAAFALDEEDTEPLDLTPQRIQHTGSVHVCFEAVGDN